MTRRSDHTKEKEKEKDKSLERKHEKTKHSRKRSRRRRKSSSSSPDRDSEIEDNSINVREGNSSDKDLGTMKSDAAVKSDAAAGALKTNSVENTNVDSVDRSSNKLGEASVQKIDNDRNTSEDEWKEDKSFWEEDGGNKKAESIDTQSDTKAIHPVEHREQLSPRRSTRVSRRSSSSLHSNNGKQDEADDSDKEGETSLHSTKSHLAEEKPIQDDKQQSLDSSVEIAQSKSSLSTEEAKMIELPKADVEHGINLEVEGSRTSEDKMSLEQNLHDAATGSNQEFLSIELCEISLPPDRETNPTESFMQANGSAENLKKSDSPKNNNITTELVNLKVQSALEADTSSSSDLKDDDTKDSLKSLKKEQNIDEPAEDNPPEKKPNIIDEKVRRSYSSDDSKSSDSSDETSNARNSSEKAKRKDSSDSSDDSDKVKKVKVETQRKSLKRHSVSRSSDDRESSEERLQIKDKERKLDNNSPEEKNKNSSSLEEKTAHSSGSPTDEDLIKKELRIRKSLEERAKERKLSNDSLKRMKVKDSSRESSESRSSEERCEISKPSSVKNRRLSREPIVNRRLDRKDSSCTVNEKTESNERCASPKEEIEHQSQERKVRRITLRRSHSNKDVTISEPDAADTSKNEDNKENTASSNVEEGEIVSEPASQIKKRRWGTTRASRTSKKTFSISNDFLKNIVPDAKPVSISEVQLTLEDDKKHKEKNDHSKRRVVEVEKKEGLVDKPVVPPPSVKEPPSLNISIANEHRVTRKISIVSGDTRALQRSPSPPRHKTSSVLFITNLVRPFTVNQLKELLARTGTIVESGFWIDNIKSKCYVEYSSETEARETRHALHGVRWPVSNPKQLCVDFGKKRRYGDGPSIS